MKVWVVNVWGREGNECLGTFSTKEAAQAKFEEFMNDHKPDSADESEEMMEYLLGLQNGRYVKAQNEELLFEAEILETNMDAKVWVVKLWEHDDGPEILGVYESKKEAQAKFEEYMNSHKPDDEDELVDFQNGIQDGNYMYDGFEINIESWNVH